MLSWCDCLEEPTGDKKDVEEMRSGEILEENNEMQQVWHPEGIEREEGGGAKMRAEEG